MTVPSKLSEGITAQALADEVIRIVGEATPYEDIAKEVIDKIMKDSAIHLRAVMVATARKKLSRIFKLMDIADRIEDALMDPSKIQGASVQQLIMHLREVNNSINNTINFTMELLDQEAIKKLELASGVKFTDARSIHIHVDGQADAVSPALDRDARERIRSLAPKLRAIWDAVAVEAEVVNDIPNQGT